MVTVIKDMQSISQIWVKTYGVFEWIARVSIKDNEVYAEYMDWLANQ